MKRSKWNEEDIEQLLQQMPKLHDHRSADDVFRQLEEVSFTRTTKRKKRNLWAVPMTAVAAAALIFMMVNPSEDEQKVATPKYKETTDVAKVNQEATTRTTLKQNEPETATEQPKTIGFGARSATPVKSYVISEVADANARIVTMGLPDKNAQNIVPVSVVVSQDDEVEAFNAAVKQVNAEALGLDGAMFANTKVMKQDGQWTIDFPAEYVQNIGSAQELVIYDSIVQTFKWWNVDKVNVTTDGQPGVNFSHIGPLSEVAIQDGNQKGYFIYETTQQWLVASPNRYETIEEALTAMKTPIETSSLKSAIAPLGNFTVDASAAPKLTITLTNDAPLADDQASSQAIDALLMAAKDFGFTAVKIDGAAIETVGAYTLTTELAMPKAPNPLS